MILIVFIFTTSSQFIKHPLEWSCYLHNTTICIHPKLCFHLGALFSLLDNETDVRMRSDIRYTLTSMLQTLAPGDLTHWLGLCRDVLSASKSTKGPAQEQQQDTSKQGKPCCHCHYILYVVVFVFIFLNISTH